MAEDSYANIDVLIAIPLSESEPRLEGEQHARCESVCVSDLRRRDVATRIKSRRRLLQMTRAQVAARAKTSVRRVALAERAPRQIPISHLHRICSAVGLSLPDAVEDITMLAT